MTQTLAPLLPSRGPDGLELTEDGPFGIDLVRPCGIPFNSVTADQLARHGFVGGWIRCWQGPTSGASSYGYLLSSDEAARACTAEQRALILAGDRVFEVPATPLAARFRVFARELEHSALCWAVTTVGSVTLWLETQAPTATAAMQVLEELAHRVPESHVAVS